MGIEEEKPLHVIEVTIKDFCAEHRLSYDDTMLKLFIRHRSRNPFSPLTDREFEVCKLIYYGHNYASIAQQMYIQPDTVKTYAKQIRKKMGIPPTVQLKMYLPIVQVYPR